ncbi:MAG: hypothetical protein A2520_10605, partial [Deltaproteobacteria bacterium RIFOXYD12_FULL_53_23]
MRKIKRMSSRINHKKNAGNSSLQTSAGSSMRRHGTVAGAFVGLLAASLSGQAFALDPNALPTDGNITSGSGSISQSGANMTVNQASQQMIANWGTFNIGKDAAVNFLQPNAQAVALNRVSSSDASLIMGSLTANGQVFLINPNGVIFGSTAKVDVQGLVASTLNISDSDFLSGNYRFVNGGSAGSILNQGEINAAEGGYVVMLAPEVINEGIVTARMGTVALAAGNAITMDLTGDGLINIVVNEAAVGALASNKGLIKADGGLVYMGARGAGDLAATVVNNEGIIEAQGLVERDGRIFLTGGDEGIVANSGSLDASSATGKGGVVDVLGARILLTGEIDASGATGGGTVLVGGDYQGKNPEVQNAQAVFASDSAVIKADALESGDGGKVIVWADNSTRYYGSISAQGAGGGKGGFIETSGKQFLDVAGIDIAAVGGTWLLDPNNITISTGATANPAGPVTGPAAWTSTADSSVVNNAEINAVLDAGTNVTIATGTGGANSQDGNILVIAPISKSGGAAATLTLTAHNDITVGAAGVIQDFSGNGLGVTLNAGGDGAGNISVDGDIITGKGAVNMTATGGSISVSSSSAINTTGGAGGLVYLDADTGITLNAAVTTGGGNVRLRANQDGDATGTLTINSPVSTGGGSFISTHDNFVNIAAGTISTAGGTVSITENGSGTADYTIAGAISSGAGDIAVSGDNIDLGANITGGTTAGAIALTGTLELTANVEINSSANNGDIAFNSSVDSITGQTRDLTVIAGTGNVTFAAAVGQGAGDPLGTLTVQSAAIVDLQNVVTTNDISITASTRIDVNSGTITSNTGKIDFNGNVDLVSGGAVTITGGAGVGDNITVTGTIGDTGDNDTLNLVAGGGSIDLQNTVTANAFTVTSAATANLANITATNDISVTATSINLDGSTYQSTNGAITLSGSIDLTGSGAVLVRTTGTDNTDDLTFSGTIVDTGADSDLTVRAIQGGTVADIIFSNDVGATGGKELNSFTVEALDSVTLKAVTTDNGAISVSNGAGGNAAAISLGGNLTSHIAGGNASTITLRGTAITLDKSGGAGSIVLDADGTGVNDNDITIVSGSLTSSTAWEDGLTLNAGTQTVDVSAATLSSLDHLVITGDAISIGATTTGANDAGAAGSLVLTATAGNITVTGDLATTGEAAGAGSLSLSASGSIVLNDADGTVAISTNSGAGTDAGITLGAITDGAVGNNHLTIDAGTGDVTLAAIGEAAGNGRIGNLTVSGNDIAFNGAVEAATISVTAAEGADADSITIAAVAIDANNNNMSFRSDNITITAGASLLSTGSANAATITFRGETDASAITLGGVDAAGVLTQAELETADAGTIGEIIIGSATQTGNLTVAAAGASLSKASLKLWAPAGGADIYINGTLALTGSGDDLTIVGSGSTTFLNADISTVGGNVDITDTILVSGTRTISTGNGAATGGDIILRQAIGSVDTSGDSLALDANGTGADGAVNVIGDIGDAADTVNGAAANDLTGFTVTNAAQVDLGIVEVTGGSIAVTGTNIDLNAATYKTTTSGSITFTGTVDLLGASPTTFTTQGGAGNNLTFNNAVDGGVDVVLDVTGTTTFNAAVGSVTPIGDGTGAALTINSTGTTSFESTLATASGITSANGAGDITFKGDVTIAAGDTATTLNNAIVNLDGLTFQSGGDITIGNAGTDQLNLTTAAVTITTTGAGDDLTVNSLVDGGQDLTLNVVGASIFNAAVGS